ncbi:UNVERIFIED_CONTAM: hypothetical protein FKN15_017411 [Acipenser sinensis]
MPFLHGFRRIIYEYQPLVDDILRVLGIEEGTGDQGSAPAVDSAPWGSLEELLEMESQSSFFLEGVSYSLFKLAETGLVSAAEILLRYQADLNFEDPVSYYNPLHIAVLRNQPAMVEALVRHGANINKRDRIHESSPLDLASEERERLPCLRTLLDLGADVNAADKNGKTALLHALASSDGVTVHNTDNIQLLLGGGADVEAVTRDGETALSSLVFLVKEALDCSREDAAQIGSFCLGATRLLLAHGADPSRCSDEEPPLTCACLELFDLHFPLAAASELLQQAESILDLAAAASPAVRLPPGFEVSTEGCGAHAEKVLDLYRHLQELEQNPAPLKQLCRAHIRHRLLPGHLEGKVQALPLPDRLRGYLLIEHRHGNEAGACCKPPRNSSTLI